MALGSTEVKRQYSIAGGTTGTDQSRDALFRLIVAYNNLVLRFDGLAAKLDADAGITDTDYQALHADALVFQLTDTESQGV